MAKRSMKTPANPRNPDIPQAVVSDRAEEPGQGIGSDERRERIARAAYFRAEQRNFQGDGQLEDWLAAEREIDSAASPAGIQGEASRLAEGPSDASAPAIQENRNEDPEHIVPSDVPRVAAELGVPANTLRVAIERAGSRITDVKRYLEQHGQR